MDQESQGNVTSGVEEGAMREESTERGKSRLERFTTERPLTTVAVAAIGGLVLGIELITGAVVGLIAIAGFGGSRHELTKRLHEQVQQLSRRAGATEAPELPGA